MGIDKRKLWGTIIGGIAFLVMTLALSYAYYTWQGSNELVSFNISDAYFYCESGIEKYIDGLYPTTNYKTGGYQKFIVNNIGNSSTTFSLTMNIKEMDSPLKSETFKYKLMVDQTGGNNNCADIDEENCVEVGSGTFENAIIGMNTLVETIFIPNNANYQYYLFIYIDGTMQNDVDMQNSAMTGVLEVCEVVVFLDYQGGISTKDFLKVNGTYEGLPLTVTRQDSIITYDTNGGGIVPETSINYTFSGWYTEKNGMGTRIESSTLVNSTINHILYANWNKSSNSVMLPTVTKEGYTFSGWYKDELLTEFVGNAGDEYITEISQTLYAKWTANTYTINYYIGNGSETPGVTQLGTSTCAYNDICYLKNFSDFNEPFPHNNYGWEFSGWADTETSFNSNYTNGASFTYTLTRNINLYAVGEKLFRFYMGINPVSSSVEALQFWNPYSTNESYLSSITIPEGGANISTWAFKGYKLNSSVADGNITYEAGITEGKPACDSELDIRGIYERTLTLNYNSNGGEGIVNSSIATQYYNTGYAFNSINIGANVSTPTFTLRENSFTKEGYDFIKWADGSTSGTQYVAGTSYSAFAPMVDNPIIQKNMYATWGDIQAPSTPVITRNDYNTFTYSSIDNIGVAGYFRSKSNIKPSADETGWVTVLSYDITDSGNYYVWAKDESGNISEPASISAYTIQRIVGPGSTLVTRYDSTSSTTGTPFATTKVVLEGTNIWAKSTANTGYGNPILSIAGNNVSNPNYITITTNLTIESSATDTQAPVVSITHYDYNTFMYNASDNVEVTGYYVSKTLSTPTLESEWVTTTSYDITEIGTYRVWAKDSSGNISAAATIRAYSITMNQGENTVLIAKYDSTSITTGTPIEKQTKSTVIALEGTNIWISATANIGYTAGLTWNGEVVENPSYSTVTSNVTITSTATINQIIFNYNTNQGVLEYENEFIANDGSLSVDAKYRTGRRIEELGLLSGDNINNNTVLINKHLDTIYIYYEPRETWGRNFSALNYGDSTKVRRYNGTLITEGDSGGYFAPIIRGGLRAQIGEEWICIDGCSTQYKKFNQDLAYSYSEFCDASIASCTALLAVNWNNLAKQILSSSAYIWTEPGFIGRNSMNEILYYPENGETITYTSGTSAYNSIQTTKLLGTTRNQASTVYVEINDTPALVPFRTTADGSNNWQKIWIRKADASLSTTYYADIDSCDSLVINGETYYAVWWYYSNNPTNNPSTLSDLTNPDNIIKMDLYE